MNYSRLVPKDSFMGRYLSYMQSQETASAYDWWCGLFCLSTACARNVYVDRPRAPVYLNLYIILVGESGIPRKSSAVASATQVIRNVTGKGHDVAHIDSKMTPEALDLFMHERTIDHGNAQLCITVSELAVFLGTERYIAHMPVMLTDLYDCPEAREGAGTILRGMVSQRNVWVSMLTASTPVWLLKTVNPNVVEGGFTSRCYFIISNTPKHRIAWPIEHDAQLFTDLCDDIKIIRREASQRRPIQLHPQAMLAFTTWYAGRGRATDPFKQSFQSREDAHVLRVAALLSVNDGSWIVKRSHINVAIKLIHQIKEDSSRIFESTESMTKYAMALDRIRGTLVSTGMDPVQRSRLFVKVRSHVTFPEFMALIEVMHEIGAIQRFELKGDHGKAVEYLRGTSLLVSRGLGEAVLERFQ